MKKFKYLIKDKISQLPKGPGVYCFKKGREFLYIGKAANLKERVKNHPELLSLAKQLSYIKADSEIEALVLEANLIKKNQPKYNVIWRDDKNYFFVAISKEEFPRVFITHQPKLKPIIYVGPFVDGNALKQTLKVLRRVFPYRSCNRIPNRPCLWYQLNRCPAPCLLKSKTAKQIPVLESKIKQECQRNAKNLIKILQGKRKQVLKNLKKEMKRRAIDQDFERAAKIRDQIEALERILAHAKIFEAQIPQKVDWLQIQKSLCQILKTNPPKFCKAKLRQTRIEAYDISNIQGQEATGSMITFINGLSDKNFYRKFKIKIAGKPNDVAMLKECLTRRFKHPEWGWPDLILIDGGRAQLNAAINLKSQISNLKSVFFVSLAKKKNELFIEGRKKSILLKELPREIFNLILQLRDEAHRFAISYHRKLRRVELLK